MTKGEALNLFRNLNQLGALQGEVKFTYGIVKNINRLKPEVEAIEKTLEFSEKFKEFNKEHTELLEKYSKKDENGKPLKKTTINADGTKQEEPDIAPENEKKVEKEFEVLKKQHKEAVDSREKQIEEYTKLLVEESDIVVHKVKLDDVPAGMNVKQLAGIYNIIEE